MCRTSRRTCAAGFTTDARARLTFAIIPAIPRMTGPLSSSNSPTPPTTSKAGCSLQSAGYAHRVPARSKRTNPGSSSHTADTPPSVVASTTRQARAPIVELLQARMFSASFTGQQHSSEIRLGSAQDSRVVQRITHQHFNLCGRTWSASRDCAGVRMHPREHENEFPSVVRLVIKMAGSSSPRACPGGVTHTLASLERTR